MNPYLKVTKEYYSPSCNHTMHVDDTQPVDELASLIERMRDMFLHFGHGKHASYLIVRKEVILPLLDEAMELSTSIRDTAKTCRKCPLWKSAKDEHVAKATMERLISYACTGDFPITVDEAENLDRILRKNYAKQL